jgi:hypothetical protein
MHLHDDGYKAGRWLLAIVLLSISSVGAYATHRDPNAPKVTVNFRATTDGFILVDASFGKGEIHTFLLDTGTTYLGALDREIANEAGLKQKNLGVAHMEGNSTTVIDITDFREATIQQKNGTNVILAKGALPVVDLSAASKEIGSPIAGVIGGLVFSRYVVEIDYGTGKLSFFEPTKFHYSGPGQAFPLEDREGYMLMEAQIELADCTLVPVRLYLDSGSNTDVTFNHLFVEAHPNLGNRKLDPRSSGIGGTIDGSWGSVHSLKIGGYSVSVPDALLLHRDAAKTTDSLTEGSLGSEVFSMFTIFIDRPDGRIIFEPRTDKPLTPVKPCVPSSTPHIQPPSQPQILSTPQDHQKSPNPA